MQSKAVRVLAVSALAIFAAELAFMLFAVPLLSNMNIESTLANAQEADMRAFDRPMPANEAVQPEVAQQPEAEPQEEAQEPDGEWYEEELYGDYSCAGSGYTGYHGDPNGLNNFDGYYDYNDRRETFYGGQAVYTDELTVDEDGFYRTEDGYYAVATNNNDIPKGTVIETSKGQAIVVDGGADSGVVDFYTDGWY